MLSKVFFIAFTIYLRPMKNIESTFYTRYSTWLGHATFVVLTIMAFAFFKERTLILDASFQSFLLLRFNDFAIQVNRFGAAMTQIFPLMASRLGGSLATILTAYSLGFVLVHWVMFWICDRVLKQKAMAFAIVLFNVFMVNNTFFWAQNEVIQAISLGFVFWSLLLRRGSFAAFQWYDFPLMLGILITLVYFHPLVIFPFAFISIYFFLDYLTKRADNFKQISDISPPLSILLILMTISGFVLITLFKNKITPNYYDTNTSTRIILPHETLLSFILRLKDVPSFKDFKAHLWGDFPLLPLSLLAITAFYVVKKRYLKLLLVWLSVLSYILIIMISYREGGSWFHIESQYLPMSIFVIMPLVWELIPEINDFKFNFNSKFLIFNSKDTPSVFSLNKGLIITTIVMSVLILSRLIDIYQTRDFYKKRVEYIGELLEKTKKLEGTKFAVEERLIDKSRLMQTWGFEYESLYYSALQSPDSMRNIAIFNNKAELKWQLGPDYTPKAMFTSIFYSDLNQRLFHQTDTIHPFKFLEEKDLK
jgi:hypothetical protein